MVLSHSRKPVAVWSRREDLLAWLACHKGVYRRFGGVAAVNRADNVRTAILHGAGAWGTIHPAEQSPRRGRRPGSRACARDEETVPRGPEARQEPR